MTTTKLLNTLYTHEKDSESYTDITITNHNGSASITIVEKLGGRMSAAALTVSETKAIFQELAKIYTA